MIGICLVGMLLSTFIPDELEDRGDEALLVEHQVEDQVNEHGLQKDSATEVQDTSFYDHTPMPAAE